MNDKMKGYKGFDSDFRCTNGMQYEVGKSYEQEGDIKVCENGLHLCPEPIDVLFYYPPYDNGFNRYAEVEGSGDSSEYDGKVAFRMLKVIKELPIGRFLSACIAGLTDTRKTETTETHQKAIGGTDYSVVTAHDYSSAAIAHGDSSIAANQSSAGIAYSSKPTSCAVSFGVNSMAYAKGKLSTAVATNCHSAAYAEGTCGIAIQSGSEAGCRTCGDDSVAVGTGIYGLAEACGRGSLAVSTNLGNQVRITGGRSVAVCMGEDNAGESTSGNGIVLCTHEKSLAKGRIGDHLVFVRYDAEDNISGVKVIRIDGKKYLPDVWYDCKGEIRS